MNLKFARDNVALTLLGPSILGAVLGLLAYQAIKPPDGTPFLAVVSMVAGAFVVSLLAYALRRFLVPDEKEDEMV